MKKALLTILIMFLGIVLAGCGDSDVPMDEQAEDGNYHYENQYLDFAITLPSEFEYYQTQRKKGDNYVDVEFFVPTSDTQHASDVDGYAKPLVVRVFDEEVWEEEVGSGTYEQVDSQDGRVYTIKFWNNIPTDWRNKWSDNIKQNIMNSFQLQ